MQPANFSMQPRTLKTLEDIRDAAAFILEVATDKTREDFVEDRLLRQATERNFEIIGEAIRRLRDHDAAVADAISEASRIISFRNTLIHGYDLVDYTLVWDVIEHKLPTLLREVEKLLQT